MKWNVLGKPEFEDKRLDAEEVVRVLLKNRGLKTKKEIKEFLHPLSPLDLSPKELGISKIQLNKAAKRIKTAIKEQEEMIVWGDYDADGVCGTAILWEAIYGLGGKVMPYIPDRVNEGYGLNEKTLKRLTTHNSQLTTIVTVDHGITAHKKIDFANKLGLEVIVVDHHQKTKLTPKAQAIVHTTEACAAAAAWFLARELLKNNQQFSHLTIEQLSLVAIGTITDLMPLMGPNRSLVKYGLKELGHTKRLGLLALFKLSGIEAGKVAPYQVGWMIGPRLNASGRLESAMDALRLLCTRDKRRARSLAEKLDRINRERQSLQDQVFNHAENLLLDRGEGLSAKLIFLAHKSYHEGVIGLVAGRLVEKFYRPVVVVARGKKYSKASARSIRGFNIIKAIRNCEAHLVDAGGHPLAAGFTIETSKIEPVAKKLNEIAAQQLDEKKLTKTLKIDCQLSLSNLSFKLVEAINKIAPFGMANPEPVFASYGLKVLNARLVGKKQDHLKLVLDDPATPRVEKTGAEAEPTSPFDGIGFGLGQIYPKLAKDKLIDVAYCLTLDTWGGRKKLQLKIKDIRVRAGSGK